jgi:hypothetical protein
MNNKDFIAMSYKERIDYFRGVGCKNYIQYCYG